MPPRKNVPLPFEEIIQITEYGILYFAAEDGDVGTVKRLLRKYKEPDTKKCIETGELLHVAAENGHLKVVEVLLNHRVNFNKTSKFVKDSTPAHVAALAGHVEVLSLLLRRGAAVGAKNKSGRTPLHLTTRHNKTECAKLLLDFKAEVNVSDVRHLTPLHLAARHGRVEIVRMFLDKGANVASVSKLAHATPLHFAAASGNLEIVKMLLNQQACVDVKDISHKTPLYYAIAASKFVTAEFLYNLQYLDINCPLDRESDILLNKSKYGKVKTLRWLLSRGANVNVTDIYNQTPLHFAATEKYPRAFKLLLSAGASVHAADRFGDTPLHFAAAYNSTAKAKILLNAGAFVNAVGFSEQTPLHSASYSSHTDVLKLLLCAGASVNAADMFGETPFHIAVRYRSKEVVNIFLGAGASINAADELSNTPLHIAARHGNTAMTKLLLAAGADVNALNIGHQTPLHVAKRKCKRILQQHMAKMTALDLFVNESNTLAIRSDDRMNSLRLKCEEEIELMKSQKIGNGVSVFDIWTKNPTQLIMYARNKDIVRVFKSEVNTSIFLVYATEIKNRFVPAIKRANLLESGHTFFDIFLAGLPRLEFVFTDEILTSLSNSDLQLLGDLVKSAKG